MISYVPSFHVYPPFTVISPIISVSWDKSKHAIYSEQGTSRND